MELTKPYFAQEPDVITDDYVGFAVGNDFNKEIIHPGEMEEWPDGVIGIRVDGNFWCVGCIPYVDYLEIPIDEIVKEFWPTSTRVSFGPDVPCYRPWKKVALSEKTC